MGLFKWLKSSTSGDAEVPAGRPTRNQNTGPTVKLSASVTLGALVQVAGTTTNSKEAAVSLVQRHELTEGTALYVTGTLQREPENAHDHAAVAVFVEGERIGYLPGYAASTLPLAAGSSMKLPLQLFCADLEAGTRVEAFLWLGDSHPEWQYSNESPPPMSPEQKRIAAQASSSEMVHDALAQGGARAAQFKAGMVNGVHYLELVEPIKELKREGRLEEALVLSYAAIEAAENGRDGMQPAPWYTEQAAIIHRKLGQKDQEIAVLSRWLAFTPANDRNQTYLGERLAKITG